MKTTIKHIFAIVLALFFVVAGTGFNIINYCCDICDDHGIEEVAKNSCEDFHQNENSCCTETQQHTNKCNEDFAYSNIGHVPDSCHIIRLNVETPTIVADFEQKITVPVIQLFSSAIPIAELLNLECKSGSIFYFIPPGFLPPSGREILSFKSVLII